MRKAILIMTGIMVLSLTAGLLGKNQPAGEVSGDTLYHDLKYDFTIKIQEGWKAAKIKNADDIFRVAITKISPVMPMKYDNRPEFFTAPRLIVLADTNMISLDSLTALITAREGKVRIMKEALKNFSLLSLTRYRPEFNPPISLKYKDFEGLLIQARKQMDAEDFIRGTIYVLRNDKITVMFEAVAELERFGFNEQDFDNMVKSIRMAPVQETPQKNENPQ